MERTFPELKPVPAQYTVPLVLHRLVRGAVELHEDVPIGQFRELLSHIAGSSTLLNGMSSPNTSRHFLAAAAKSNKVP